MLWWSAFTMAVVVAFATKKNPPIPIRSPLTVTRRGAGVFSSANGSRAPVVSRNRRLPRLPGGSENTVSGGHGERDLFLVSLHFHFHFWQPPLLRRVSYPPSRSRSLRYTPLSVSLSLSFSSPSVYALLEPSLSAPRPLASLVPARFAVPGFRATQSLRRLASNPGII